MTLAEAHQLLGLRPEGLTFEALRARWHELALVHHPDKGGNAARFAVLNEAHQLVLPTVPEAAAPEACARCGGTGRVQAHRGFSVVWLTCECQLTKESD